MTKMLNSLREATEELHRKLEGENLAGKIMDHSISLEEYKLLIYQNFIAYRSVEKNTADLFAFPAFQKTAQLKKDLDSLDMTEPSMYIDFNCKNQAEAIGAAYVVEGSAMGGLMIGRELKNCDALANLSIQHFFSGERSSMQGWNQFLKFLRSREFTEAEIDQACAKAKETFLLFEKAFSLQPANC